MGGTNDGAGKDAAAGGADGLDDAIVVDEDVNGPLDWWSRFTADRRRCEQANGSRAAHGSQRTAHSALVECCGGLARTAPRRSRAAGAGSSGGAVCAEAGAHPTSMSSRPCGPPSPPAASFLGRNDLVVVGHRAGSEINLSPAGSPEGLRYRSRSAVGEALPHLPPARGGAVAGHASVTDGKAESGDRAV